KEALAALRHLDAYLPHPSVRGNLGHAVSERLKALIGGEVSFWLDAVRVVHGPDIRKLVDSPTVLAVVSAGPSGPRGLIEVELGPNAQESWRQWVQSSLHRLGGAKVTLSAVVGETELTGAELAAVEEGDVVVVENFMLAPDLRTGKAVVTAGRGRNARVHVAV